LAAFSSYARHAGPREDVFSALCRKNFGCTHFVLGHCHAQGGLYRAEQTRELFEFLGDIGIAPVFFDTVYFSEADDATIESPEQSDGLRELSGTRIRALLASNQDVPAWCMRNELSGWLTNEYSAGSPLFVSTD
jgi:ATP sulfurylase